MRALTIFALILCANVFTPLILAEEPRLEKPFTHHLQKTVDLEQKKFLRVATWNIEWFPAGMRQDALENVQWQTAAVATLIKEIKPDILLTQETRNLGALISLNNNLGSDSFNHLASSWFNDENKESQLNNKIQQQVGFLSLVPWTDIWEVDFSTLPSKDRPARGWLAARFEVGTLKFVVYNGHLKSNFGAANLEDRASNYAKRLAAIHELKKDLERQNLDPYRDKILICGDLNTDFFAKEFEDEKTLSELQNMGFTHTFGYHERENRITLPARAGEPYPDGTFDYIWVSSGWGKFAPSAQVLQKGASKRKEVFGGDEPRLASDHYPVYIDIPLTTEP